MMYAKYLLLFQMSQASDRLDGLIPRCRIAGTAVCLTAVVVQTVGLERWPIQDRISSDDL